MLRLIFREGHLFIRKNYMEEVRFELSYGGRVWIDLGQGKDV